MEKSEKIVGTNCFNCIYITTQQEQASDSELNEEGGIDPKNPQEMERAKKADLITLPGGEKSDGKIKKACGHPQIQMFVTARMCCAYWDNKRVKRPWKKS